MPDRPQQDPCNRRHPNQHQWSRTLDASLPDLMVDSRPFVLPTVLANVSVTLCLVPKAASTSIKRWLFGTLRARGYAFAPDSWECAHPQPALRGLPEPTASLMVVRHPAMRLASAWLEIRARNFAWRLPPHVAPNASFAETVHALVRTPPMQINPHLRPLLYTCGILSGRRYRVLRYEEWPRLAATLAGHFAPSPAAPPLAFRGSTTTHEHASRLYTPALAQRVSTWAAADVRLFGYLPWRPGEPVRMRADHEAGWPSG